MFKQKKTLIDEILTYKIGETIWWIRYKNLHDALALAFFNSCDSGTLTSHHRSWTMCLVKRTFSCTSKSLNLVKNMHMKKKRCGKNIVHANTRDKSLQLIQKLPVDDVTEGSIHGCFLEK